MAGDEAGVAAPWDQRYREGTDGWELGRPAPPLEQALRHDPRAPRPPGRVLVPGCGRGHEAALLSALGFEAIGLDVSGEALAEARRLYGPGGSLLQWLQADLFERSALARAGLGAGSLAAWWSTPASAPSLRNSARPTWSRSTICCNPAAGCWASSGATAAPAGRPTAAIRLSWQSNFGERASPPSSGSLHAAPWRAGSRNGSGSGR